MFIISMKANRKKIFALFIIIGVLFVGVFAITGKQAAVKANRHKTASCIVENNQQRIEYLKSFGWIVEEEACEIVEVAIPEDFNDVYQEYNKIQKKQGFDLEDYKGKRAKRYSYEVKNYPNQPEYVRANMLVYNNQIIAGDICSLALDGFMHGFQMPKQ